MTQSNLMPDGRYILNKTTTKIITDKNKNEIIETNIQPCQVLEPLGPEWLYSLSFDFGKHYEKENKLFIELQNVTNLIQFTNRPDRLWNPINLNDLIELWLDTKDFNNFWTDNPNASLIFDDQNHIIKLINCLMENNKLIFEIEMISDKLIPKIFQQCSINIDAHKKAGGSSRNGRDSRGRRLSVKKYGGQSVIPGNIILRRRGINFRPGENVGRGTDHSIFATINGKVEFNEIDKSEKKKIELL
ncbi:Ribosomal L27 protein [seawater metagenome]|uniref:Ribosomal L27 protein n=1 Tax=seawater metagenome TaxID=1561972 RepID=A0A5E8CLB8_9ZZZZ